MTRSPGSRVLIRPGLPFQFCPDFRLPSTLLRLYIKLIAQNRIRLSCVLRKHKLEHCHSLSERYGLTLTPFAAWRVDNLTPQIYADLDILKGMSFRWCNFFNLQNCFILITTR